MITGRSDRDQSLTPMVYRPIDDDFISNTNESRSEDNGNENGNWNAADGCNS